SPEIGVAILDGCAQQIVEYPVATPVLTGVTALSIPHSSALYAIDFEVNAPVTHRASLDLYIFANDTLGGGPNQGVYLNGVPLSGDTTGGDCLFDNGPRNIFRDDITVHVGTNTLYLNVTHTDGSAGLLFYAEIRVDGDAPHYIHVKENAPPGGDGSTWATAFADLQDALDEAETSADPNREIWLAGGTYKPTRLEDLADPRSMTFRLLKDVSIIGGFAGTETSRDQRLPGVNTTIISGDISGDDVFNPSHPTWNENAYHIFTGSQFLRRADLTDVTITHGKANGQGWDEDVGSALYMPGAGSLTLNNCHVDDNYCEFGGTIYLLDNASLTMTNGGASGNYNFMRYGFISAQFECDVVLDNCDFVDNEASTGTVVSLESASRLVASDCTFTDNSAVGIGGVVAAQVFDSAGITDAGIHLEFYRCDFLRNQTRSDGGAIWLKITGTGNTGSLTVSNCTFDEVSSTGVGSGGVIYANNTRPVSIPVSISGTTFTACTAPGGTGGALYLLNLSPVNVTDCWFEGGVSKGDGAAAYVTGHSPTFQRCSFVDNQSSSGDAALAFAFADHVTVDRCSFIRNSGREWGGGLSIGGFTVSADVFNSVFLDNECRSGRGGALQSFAPDTEVANSIFVGNHAYLQGGAIDVWDTFLILSNSIVYGNTTTLDSSGGLYGINSYFVINNSIIRNNTDSSGGGLLGQLDGDATTVADINYSNVEGVTQTDGNFDLNPYFLDPLGIDGTLGTEDDDFRHSTISPGIDAGDNSLVSAGISADIDGNARFLDDPDTVDVGSGTPPIVDMGPYEFLLGDCDRDGVVNLHDYSGFETCFKGPIDATPPGCRCFDLNASDHIDVNDYAVFARSLQVP
ncbi:MAG: right-handed parallel beta-helix repeat-containing protein, partial [Planctomycetota bacterium]